MVVNELGEIGLDNVMIAQATDNVVLLDAGCLCCANTGALHETLADLDGRRARGEIPPFERVIIETSGAADPAPLLNVLLGHPLVTAAYAFEATVCTSTRSTSSPRAPSTRSSTSRPPSPSASTSASAIWPIRRRFWISCKEFNAEAEVLETPAALFSTWGKEKKYKVSLDTKGRIGRREHFSGIRAHAFRPPPPVTWAGWSAWSRLAREEFGARLIRVKGLLQMEDTIAFVQGVQGVFHPPQRFRTGRMPITRNRLVCISRDLAGRRHRHHAAGAQHARRHAGPLLDAGTQRKVRTTMSDFVLRGGTLVFPDRAPEKKDVLVKAGKIDSLLAPGAAGAGRCRAKSAKGLHVFPGLIDCHVHFGMGEKITEYATETANAAQGGFTTVLGYFLNNEAYGDVFRRELQYAVERAHVDFGFHFSTANELHIKELGEYVKDYGVTSFKYFMNFKGEEGRYLGLDGTDDGFFYDLLKESARVGRPIVVCHTENIEIVNRERRKVQARGGNTLKDWSASKPALTESEPALRAMYLAEELGARVYFPHISSRKALDVIRFWRKRFKDVIVETCPHYLTHTEDSDLGGMGKANPPFRTKDDQDAIWEAIFDGTVDLVASDHNARKKVNKDKPLWLASQGFPATASMLPVMLSEGYHKRKLPLQRICQLLGSDAGEGLRPRAAQGLARARRGRRLHAGRSQQGARAARRRLRFLRRLQPARRLEPQRLAGARDLARRHRDGRSQAGRQRRPRQIPLAPHRPAADSRQDQLI